MKVKLIAAALIVITIFSMFYWAEIRPFLDRRYCNDRAGNEAEPYGTPSDSKAFSLYGRYYTTCVNDHGLGE